MVRAIKKWDYAGEMILVARATVMMAWGGCFLVIGLMGLVGTPSRAQVSVDAIQYEHRVTSLEGAVQNLAGVQKLMADQLNDLRNTKWLELIALSGLMGETGLRTLKSRIRKTED